MDTTNATNAGSAQMDADVMQQKIREYREMLKKQHRPELDIQLLFRILRLMNESSEVRVGIDPIGEDGKWESKAPTYSVAGLTQLADGRYALRVNDEKHGMTVDKLESKLKKAFKGSTGSGVPVLFVRGESVTQLTDAYSHALVREQWAGMPYDLVLAVRTPKKETAE